MKNTSLSLCILGLGSLIALYVALSPDLDWTVAENVFFRRLNEGLPWMFFVLGLWVTYSLTKNALNGGMSSSKVLIHGIWYTAIFAFFAAGFAAREEFGEIFMGNFFFFLCSYLAVFFSSFFKTKL